MEGIDYSKYRCPHDNLEKECGHELNGPENYDTNSVWCKCGYRGPVLYLDPVQLGLRLKAKPFKIGDKITTWKQYKKAVKCGCVVREDHTIVSDNYVLMKIINDRFHVWYSFDPNKDPYTTKQPNKKDFKEAIKLGSIFTIESTPEGGEGE